MVPCAVAFVILIEICKVPWQTDLLTADLKTEKTFVSYETRLVPSVGLNDFHFQKISTISKNEPFSQRMPLKTPAFEPGI
jgi:hypothetical protein